MPPHAALLPTLQGLPTANSWRGISQCRTTLLTNGTSWSTWRTLWTRRIPRTSPTRARIGGQLDAWRTRLTETERQEGCDRRRCISKLVLHEAIPECTPCRAVRYCWPRPRRSGRASRRRRRASLRATTGKRDGVRDRPEQSARLAFGPRGDLYVAEGGLGGSRMTTPAECAQVPDVGPYSGGFTSRISKIGPDGVRTTVAGGLPSSQTSPASGSLVSGVADVAFARGRLYALKAAPAARTACGARQLGLARQSRRHDHAGRRSQPVPEVPSGREPGPGRLRAGRDLVQHGRGPGRSVRGRAQPRRDRPYQSVHRRDPPRDRHLGRPGHIVPTALAYKGNFFFGNLGTFPVTPGSQSLFKVTPGGQIKTRATGLTTVLGLVPGPTISSTRSSR